MANTEKQGFRYPTERWKLAVTKMEAMRAAGYDIDMTKVLAAEVDRVIAEAPAETAKRLGLERAEDAVPQWRKPFARSEAST